MRGCIHDDKILIGDVTLQPRDIDEGRQAFGSHQFLRVKNWSTSFLTLTNLTTHDNEMLATDINP